MFLRCSLHWRALKTSICRLGGELCRKQAPGARAVGAKCFRLVVMLVLGQAAALASGPHWVAGVTYFDPAAKGTPVVWAGGQVKYYLDQGRLSTLESNFSFSQILYDAAAVWSSVPTAQLTIVNAGTLNEDVNGSNVTANSPAGTGATLPADVQPTATSKPLGVILDADGSVINAIYGQGASDPSECPTDGVFTQVDNLTVTGNIAHALIIVNGLCATTTAQLTLLKYLLVRAFGRVLGLDWSQVNEAMFLDQAITTEGLTGWPIMHPFERLCSGSSYNCMPNPTTLRLDDVAGINRLYPVTSANIGSSSTKQITAQATISVQGTIAFKGGQGMQGVNVVLTPLVGGVPDVRYSVSAVSGVSFHSNAGNPVTGSVDAQGNSLNRYGTDDPTMEGFFDLSGVPLPTGTTVSDYQLSFEAVDPLYTNEASVGPYATSQVSPSGTMVTLVLSQLQAGTAITQNVTVEDSADESHADDGTESAPNGLTPNGEWLGRLTGYGHTGWFLFEAKANRVFTLEATSLDATGLATLDKAGVVLGFWNGSDVLGTLPDLATTQPFNGAAAGLTTLAAQTSAAGQVRVAIADTRGDGRPDYLYRGRVLYADSVYPARLSPAGGPIVIQGTGFRPNAQVQVNGVSATVTSVTPTQLTAIAPAASGTTGVVPVTVSDPTTLGSASILDGLSYDAFGSDQIGLVSGPSGTMAGDVPVPMTVRVVAADNVTPAAGVAVTFSVQQGGAALGCGASTCSVTTNGAGKAVLMVTPTSLQTTSVVATLTNGAAVAAEFSATPAPLIAAVTPTLYLAIGGQASWQPSAIVLNSGVAVTGAGVNWAATSAGVTVQSASSTTSQAGVASTTITAGPLAAGATATLNACETSSSMVCASFTVNAVHSELAALVGISGAGQELAASATPLPVVLEVTDAVGHPLAGATVNFYETLDAWQPACPSTGRCPAVQTLATQAVTTTSDANGMVTLTPLTGGGEATTLVVNATTGQQASLVFSIVQHP